MAIAPVNTTTLDTNGATSPSWSHTVGSGSNRLLTVILTTWNDCVSGVTYGGVAMTQVAKRLFGATLSDVEYIYALVAPTSGAATVQVTSTAGLTGRIGAVDWTGVDQATPTSGGTGAAATTNTPTVSVTSAAGDVVLGGMSCDQGSSGTPTMGAGQTQLWAFQFVAAGETSAASYEDGGTTVTHSYGLAASKEWALAAVNLKAATGAGATAPPCSEPPS
jgi:hypothetical protein